MCYSLPSSQSSSLIFNNRLWKGFEGLIKIPIMNNNYN